MEWININDKLPPDNEKVGGKTYLTTVMCDTWKNPETMIMEWECTTIKNKDVKRWKWRDRIKYDFWVVTHWMELPPPATEQ